MIVITCLFHKQEPQQYGQTAPQLLQKVQNYRIIKSHIIFHVINVKLTLDAYRVCARVYMGRKLYCIMLCPRPRTLLCGCVRVCARVVSDPG
jgi:hypothetical protein